MRIVRLSNSAKKYGGNIYERYIDEVLSRHFDYSLVSFNFKLRGFLRLLELPRYIWFIYKISRNNDYFLIRNSGAALFNFARPARGLTIVFHFDATGSSLFPYVYQVLVEKIFWWRSSKKENILVIAKYWEDLFRHRGFQHLRTIYCPFNIEEYNVAESELSSFREKYGIDSEDQLVYIGNPQRKKGAHWVADQLRHEGYRLVSSGTGEHIEGVEHFDLSFREYLCLLKSAKVVISMSLFKEGWCRVAHEALLLGTPVIGSGAGGMRELLEGAGLQIQGFDHKFKEQVRKIVNGEEKPSINREYLSSFGMHKFSAELKQWMDQIAKD